MVTDGEQRKYHNFAAYAVHGLPNTAPDGFKIRYQNRISGFSSESLLQSSPH